MEMKGKERAKLHADNPSQSPWLPREIDHYPEQ